MSGRKKFRLPKHDESKGVTSLIIRVGRKSGGSPKSEKRSRGLVYLKLRLLEQGKGLSESGKKRGKVHNSG